jgi:SAM-dependent methyltransferase
MTNNPSSSGYGDNMSGRKQEIRALADASASERQNWLKRSAFFHNEDLLYLKFLIPEGARVLELGCGTGELLAALKPSFGDLIFGASKLGLKAVEIPIRYASRTYGETQISRFRHGFLLLRMVLFAFMRIKSMQ